MNYVYVMTADGLTKIGVSHDPQKRREALRWTVAGYLQISAVRRFDEGAFQIERRAHKLLAEHSVHGEWFRVRPGVALKAIRQAAIDHARHVTRPNLPRYLYVARPEIQSYYKMLLAKMAYETAFEHLGERAVAQGKRQVKVNQHAGRRAGATPGRKPKG